MHHELGLEYLAQQRSEELIRRAEQHNRFAGSGPTRPHRIDRKLAAFLARARVGRPAARRVLRPSSDSHAGQP